MAIRNRIAVMGLVASLALVGACGSDEGDAERDAPAPTGQSGGTDQGTMDHGGMDHDMDHGDMDMDHSGMDHDMDHGDMDHSATGDMGHSGDGHGDSHGPVTLAKPLAVLPDGTIDPDKVDLSGVEGVTAEQQAAAEDLLVRTIRELPRWADREQAIADGFKSINDGITGEEHLLRWDWIEDDVIFDPTRPEALVYNTRTETPQLEAAMFMLPKRYTLENVPEFGGKLMQYHIHNDLCFTTGDAPIVGGLTDGEGKCRPPLQKFNPNAMVHVWIRPNECGPFASLLGVGAGQIAAGEERSCLKQEGELSL